MAWDCATPEVRDQLVAKLKMAGLNMGGSGDVSIRMRPMLVFGHKHASTFIGLLEETLKKMP